MGGTAATFVAVVALGAARLPAAEAFADPLDVPARTSALASRRPLGAVSEVAGRLVAVGQRGHVLVSDDGGASWSQASVPVSTDLTSVWFACPRRGWAAGHDGVVLATVDGGRTWVKQLDGRRIVPLLEASYAPRDRRRRPGLERQLEILAAQGAGQALLDLWFADERTGFAVGAFGLVLRTDDGGRTWIPWIDRTENPRGLHLHAIRRVAGEVWIAGEQGLVLKLDPAARRFRAVRVGYGGSFFGVTGSARAVVVHGLRGSAFRSVDGGSTWRRVPTGTDLALTGATVTQDGRILLVTQAGQVLASGDEGASFALARESPERPASAVAATGAGALVIVGAGGVRRETLR